jgi:Undecaprenyl-phosphate galactose phosphotransferase WbaP
MRLSRPRIDGNLHANPDRMNHLAPPSRYNSSHERQFWIERVAWLPEIQKRLRSPSWTSAKPPRARRRKRVADIALGAALIVFFAPLMAVIAVAVCLDGGPVFYGHSRIGPDRRRFRCWKFRTMVVNADQILQEVLARDSALRAEWESSFKLHKDPRITLVGRFLRALSFDELPQLFNVMRGEMSLVGPRPIVEAEIDRYGPKFTAYCACRPGITGLWQVRGRSDVSYARRVELDNEYANAWSLWLDLQILLNTVVVIIRRDGAY